MVKTWLSCGRRTRREVVKGETCVQTRKTVQQLTSYTKAIVMGSAMLNMWLLGAW